MQKDELFAIEAPGFRLAILGPLPSPNSLALREFPGGVMSAPTNRFQFIDIVVPVAETKIPLLRVERSSPKYTLEQVVISVGPKYEKDGNSLFLPLFFENIDYQVELISTASGRFSLWHEYSSIRNNLTAFHKFKSFSGTFNFGNNVGVSSFQIVEEGIPHLTITFAVFSIKVDFYKERLLMMEELSDLHNTLIFSLFRPTTSSAQSVYRPSLGLEWLVSFYQLSDELVKTIHRIEKKAYHQIQSQIEVVAIRKIKRPNKSYLRQVTIHGKKAILAKRNLSIERRRVEVSTRENKYIKFLMRRILTLGRTWLMYVNQSDLPSLIRIRENESILDQIKSQLELVGKSLHNDFWESVGEDLPILHNKTAFLFQELFVKFERLFRTLNSGVSVHINGTQFIFTLPMDKLYEIWTYCKLAEIISILVNPAGSIVAPKTKVNAFQAVLLTGHAARTHIDKDISISANWLFTTDSKNLYFSPIVPQEPDLVFEVRNQTVLNIFDAKYQIDVAIIKDGRIVHLSNADLISKDLSNEEVIFRPKEENINTIHRYKDAIQTQRDVPAEEKSRRAVRTGAILYPHKPSRSETDRIEKNFENLRSFRIGAVPLAPGNSDSEWMYNLDRTEDLIPDDASSEQIRLFAKLIREIIGQVAP